MKRRLTTNQERYTNIKTKAFSKYLNDIAIYKPLDPTEEHDLCLRMVQGDTVAREKIIKHNLRFVISIAKQYYSNTTTVEDLINEGNYGLIIATNKFDPSRGFKFITYAVWWIRNMIIRYLNTDDSLVKLPNHKVHNMGKMRGDYERLEQLLEKKPTAEDMYQEFSSDYSMDDIKEFMAHSLGRDTSLDKSMDDEGGATLMDMMENTAFPSTDVLTQESDTRTRIKYILSNLKNEKQSTVITKMWGLDGEEPLNLEMVSREMGISTERVRQIKEKTLLILRNKLKTNNIYN
jgi:RNA polymerase primary sigma factor